MPQAVNGSGGVEAISDPDKGHARINTVSDRPSAQPTAILVVEDELLIRMIAADLLTGARYHVVEAGDAQEALSQLDARDDVRLVFTDCNMPGAIDGIALAHIVQERWPAIATLVTSGKMCPATRDLLAGARFIQKPYRASTLIDAVAELLATGDLSVCGAPTTSTCTTGPL